MTNFLPMRTDCAPPKGRRHHTLCPPPRRRPKVHAKLPSNHLCDRGTHNIFHHGDCRRHVDQNSTEHQQIHRPPLPHLTTTTMAPWTRPGARARCRRRATLRANTARRAPPPPPGASPAAARRSKQANPDEHNCSSDKTHQQRQNTTRSVARCCAPTDGGMQPASRQHSDMAPRCAPTGGEEAPPTKGHRIRPWESRI
jgi:hypothetical protein